MAAAAPLKPDEGVELYPTVAVLETDREGREVWRAGVHFHVFEPGDGAFASWTLRRVFGLEDDALSVQEKRLLSERLRLFLVDNERAKTLRLRVAEREHVCGPTAANGHYQGEIRIPAAELDGAVGLSKTGGVSLREMTISPQLGGGRAVNGRLWLVPPVGFSVISDIDDTIKISQVREHKELLKNTFIRPYREVPGMAELYRDWALRADCHFYYLTASPWQLYGPLAEFLERKGFPAGAWRMRSFRLQDGSFLDLFMNPVRYKVPAVEEILRRHPDRRFILVGDSGEQDPEIYGQIARRHPGQIYRILIRNVSGEPPEAERYRKAFRDLRAEVWRLFESPAQLERLAFE